MNSINSIFEALNAQRDEDGDQLFNVELRDQGELPVIRVTEALADENALPIHIIVDEHQIRCITYLFTLDEIKDDRKEEFYFNALNYNLNVPLTCIGMDGKDFTMVGKLSITSSIEDILHEIEVQNCNIEPVLAESVEFLKMKTAA